MDRIRTRDARGAGVGVSGIAVEMAATTVAVVVGTEMAVSVGKGEDVTAMGATPEELQASKANNMTHIPLGYFDLNISP
jgi:hypothetical protein